MKIFDKASSTILVTSCYRKRKASEPATLALHHCDSVELVMTASTRSA